MYYKCLIAVVILCCLDLAATVPVPDEDSSENKFAIGDAIKNEIKTVMGATCITDGGCSIISYCYKEKIIEGLDVENVVGTCRLTWWFILAVIILILLFLFSCCACICLPCCCLYDCFSSICCCCC